MQPQQIWQATLGELQLQLARPTFETWLRDVEFLSCETQETSLSFVVSVESAYAKDWLENHLLSTIRRSLTGVAGQLATVRFVVGQMEKAPYSSPRDMAAVTDDKPQQPLPICNLPHRYQTASSSDLDPDSPIMRSAAIAYGRSVKGCYKGRTAAARERRQRAGWPEEVPLPANNLILCGPSGAGKTHLAAAIGRLAAGLGFEVVFVGVEAMLKALQRDIRFGERSGHELLQAACQCDLLILDDLNAGRLAHDEAGNSDAPARDPEASVSLLTRSEWAVGEVKALIHTRYDTQRGPAPIIVTSNQSANELQMSALDNATISRLLGGAVIAEIPQDALDYRFHTYQRPNREAVSVRQ